MKRRHEFSLDAGPSSLGVRDSGAPPLDDNLERAARQILKRRRVAGPDAWNGTTRRNSPLQDIHNFSQNGTLPDDPSTSKIVSNQTGKIPSSALKDYSSLSRPSTLRPRVTEPAASNSEHPGSPRTSSSFPRQSLSGPSLGAQPTTSVPRTHPPLVPTPDKPVRIRQPRDSQHRYTTDQGRESDEEEDEETDGEEQDEDPEPVVGSAVDSAERELVESRYSEINKLLGGLFLSRHRNPP